MHIAITQAMVLGVCVLYVFSSSRSGGSMAACILQRVMSPTALLTGLYAILCPAVYHAFACLNVLPEPFNIVAWLCVAVAAVAQKETETPFLTAYSPSKTISTFQTR